MSLSTCPYIKDGWFKEVSDKAFPGQGFMLKVEKILYHQKSNFQDILVFKSTNYGNVLVLDGIIQVTERDEFAYQEMISHVPMFAHKNPKRILVIGGGDGGVIREIVKHECIESVTLVEIDETVINLSKTYLPKMSCALDHPKVRVKLLDGFKFLQDISQTVEGKYDIIITDSSDPEGPAEAFFQLEYFHLLHNALNDDGIVIAQTSENIWLNLDYLKTLMDTAKSVFLQVKYCYTMVPTYTSGQLGLLVCAKSPLTQLDKPIRKPNESEQSILKYYNELIHTASFILPTWAKDILNQ